MTKIGKLWTGAVAYVSLLVGAGLSVAGNLADTYRIRGSLTDAVDIVLAVGPPLASLLVAELFVSAWPRKLSVQSIRWAGTLSVGLLATVVSWLHINELLMARGQLTLVAILWPLAIDGLAIMAMAKILVTRGHVATVVTFRALSTDSDGRLVATGQPVDMDMATDTWTPDMGTGADMDTSVTDDQLVAIRDTLSADMDTSVTQPMPPFTEEDAARMATELDQWENGMDMAIADAGHSLAAEAEAFLGKPGPIVPVVTPDRIHAVPVEVQDAFRAWASTSSWQAPISADVVPFLAAWYGVSPRTIRRWKSAVLGPVLPGENM